MNKQKEIFNEIWKILLVIALLIGSISLTMNVLSLQLEKETQPEKTYQPVEYYATDDARSTLLLLAGRVDYGTRVESTDYTNTFSDIRSLTSNYKLAVYSQDSFAGWQVPTWFADSMIASGFNIVGLANPNAYALGKEAIENSMAYWKTTTAQVSGTNLSTDEQNQISISESNGITVAYLSFTDFLNDELPSSSQYLVNQWDDNGKRLVEKASTMADVVVVSIAWENAQQTLPTDHQKEIAKQMADAGASVIVGNSGNVIQPIEWIDDTIVFYSLGNFLSDEENPDDRIGMIASVTVTESGQGNTHRVELTNPKVEFVESVEDGDGYKVEIMQETDDLYQVCVNTALMMDDSIRIGGM